MRKYTNIISGYLVELEVFEGESQCFVEYNDKGTFYSASLAALDATGELESRTGKPRRVPTSTIDRITDWAVTRGY
jgi:hypothetical protein